MTKSRVTSASTTLPAREGIASRPPGVSNAVAFGSMQLEGARLDGAAERGHDSEMLSASFGQRALGTARTGRTHGRKRRTGWTVPVTLPR